MILKLFSELVGFGMKLKAGHWFFTRCIFVFSEYVLVSYRSVSRMPRHFDVIFQLYILRFSIPSNAGRR